MFERELDYYGIGAVEARITGQHSLPEVTKSFRKTFQEVKTKHDMFFLAAACYHQFWGKASAPRGSSKDYVTAYIKSDHDLYDESNTINRKLLDEYLERYFGLAVAPKQHPNRLGEGFRIHLAKQTS